MFEALGYRRSEANPDDFILKSTPDQVAALRVALCCCIASREVEIYINIFHKVKRDGFTEHDVMKSRLNCAASEKVCVLWIHDNCVATRPKILQATINVSPITNTVPTTTTATSATMKPMDVDRAVTRSMTKNTRSDVSHADVTPRLTATQPPAIPKRTTVVPQSFVKDFPTSDAGHRLKATPMQTQAHTPGRSGFDDIPFIDAAGAHDAATLDEHVEQSLLLVDRQPLLGPDREASVQSQGSEWKEVFSRVQSLGPSYYDPGGRGDILKGDRMVPHDNSDSEHEFPPPPTPEQLAQLNNATRVTPKNATPNYERNNYSAIMSSYASGGARPKVLKSSLLSPQNESASSNLNNRNRSSDSSWQSQSPLNHVFTSSAKSDARHFDLYSPDSASAQLAPPLSTFSRHSTPLGASHINPASVKVAALHSNLAPPQQQFSTFRTSDAAAAGNALPRLEGVSPLAHDTSDPDYADLRRVSPRGGGKPSYQHNFQSTTQRIYNQHSSEAREGRSVKVVICGKLRGSAKGQRWKQVATIT